MRIGIGIGVTSVQAGAAAFMSGLSNANATGGTALSCAGSLLAYAPNTLRWGCLDGGRAVLVEAAGTNYCANSNANPTNLTGITKYGDAAGVISIVDDSAALAEAGLDGVCTSGKVVMLDNSAGSSEVVAFIAGSTPASGSIIGSAYLRGGSGVLRYSGNAATTPFGANDSYRRINTPAYTTTEAKQLVVGANSGEVVYFILNQSELGTAPTSPIVVSGAAATRAADLVTAPITADVSNGVRVRGTFRMDGTTGSFNRVFQLDDGTNANAFWLLWLKGSLDQLYWQYKFNGADISGGPAGFIALGETFDCDVTATGDGVSGVVNGVQFSRTFSSTHIPITTARIGGDQVGANIPARLLCSKFLVSGV